MPRGGVVRDPAVRREVLLRFGEDAVAAGFVPTNLMRSPITGTDVSVEFLALLEKVPTGVDWMTLVERLSLA